MVQPEILLYQLQVYSGRPGVTNILDAWHAYFDAHGVPYMALLDRLAYHANLRGVSVSDVWTGNITVPSQVLISALPGFSYDISNTSTLWQDVAGTIPAGEGDIVARVDDVSSRGNHATQADPAKCPIYYIDWAGRGFLQFDGVDDHLTVPALNMTAYTQSLLVTTAKRDTLKLQQVLSPTVASAPYYINTAVGSRTFGLSSAFAEKWVTDTDAEVSSVVYDASAATPATGINTVRVNRDASGYSYNGSMTPGALPNSSYVIGATGAGTNRFYHGRLYGMTYRAVTDGGAARIALEDYYAERAGL